jgi:hypothetical protein
MVPAEAERGAGMSKDAKADDFRENPAWANIIPDEQWAVYLDAIRVTRKTRARFVLGGAFGLASYTGRWRNTKDLDFFVLPSDKDKIVDALTKAGFEDLYPRLSYDRGWIYRAVRDDVIVDVIWQTPNRRSVVDEEWFSRSRKVILRDEPLAALPPEELLAIKLYVIQRDRCDWPDLLNLLYQTCDQLDWSHLLDRLGAERPLLTGLLHLFNWVAPARALRLPREIRELLHLAEPNADDLALPDDERVRLLDSRPWFAAFQPTDQPMML